MLMEEDAMYSPNIVFLSVLGMQWNVGKTKMDHV